MPWIDATYRGVYAFDNGRTVTVHGMPLAPVVWTYNALDFVCQHAGCSHWRDVLHLNDNPDSWWSDTYRVPSLRDYFPKLLTLSDFQQQNQQQQLNPNHIPKLWDTVYRYAFHTPSTALADLTTPTAMIALLALVLVLRLVKAVTLPYCRSVGRRAAQRTHGAAWVTAPENQVRLTKFGEYVFRLVFHAAIAAYGLAYFYDQEWWQPGNTNAVFRGYPYHEIQPNMAWYYLMQAAYNVDALYSLLVLSLVVKVQSMMRSSRTSSSSSMWQSPIVIEWSPTVRGDFQEMMMHHVITNVLVIGSSFFRLSRIGSSKCK